MFAQHSSSEANDKTASLSSAFSHLSPLLTKKSDSSCAKELFSSSKSLVLLVNVGGQGGYAIYTEYCPGATPSNL